MLRRDVDGALRPRLSYLSSVLGATEAHRLIVANPRLLMSSFGVLGRLRFVVEAVPEGLAAASPSSAIMAPRAVFARRFPDYVAWLKAQVPDADSTGADDLGKLEGRHGDLLEHRVTALQKP